ncbi:MAG: PEP-CTERM sorting domain-containing protein [Planctomycetota bacterium]
MSTRLAMLTAMVALTSMISLASTARAEWQTFVIRQGGDVSPAILDNSDYGVAAKEFVISAASMKAGWGTNAMNGQAIGDLAAISINRLDDTSRFAVGSGPAVAPYFNIWITDGLGKYAVVANEPSNAEWTGTTEWNMTWDILKTKSLKVYENNDKSWLPNNGVGLTFADLKDFTIQAPSAAELTIGWAGLGTGAPRELGTNVAYGFNWVFGDTLSNYVSGAEGYVVANPTVVPEPGMLALLGMGAAGIGVITIRRRKARA